ncbi:hypothetical protein BGX38DRAFT_1333890, partial [Terfezia claveryi]
MAAYTMMGACDMYPRVRPTIRRAVTAPNNKPNTLDTPQAKPGEQTHRPPRPFTLPRVEGNPSLQEHPLLNERDLMAAGSLHPVAGCITTPSACHPERGNALDLKLQLSADTKHALQSDPTPGTIVTISRLAYTALTDLAKHLKTHSLFHTHINPRAVSTLRIHDLSPSEYLELYNLLEPQLEGFRIKVDFHDTTLIMRRPSGTHESGVKGWMSVGFLLQTQMSMPPGVKECFDFKKGQPDTWLWRPIKDEIAALEDHAVQCVIIFKINENLSKHWLPAFQQAFRKNNFNTNRDLAPNPTSFLSKVALQSIVLTVEIWRNEKDAITGELKREHTVRKSPTCTIPTYETFHALQDHTPIPRSTICTTPQ